MNFLEAILSRLAAAPDHPFLEEARAGSREATTGSELLDAIARVRAFSRAAGLAPGDRCALLGANSAAWAACDLGLMAEGVVVVPLFARQRPPEMARILRDSAPKLWICQDTGAAEAVRREAPEVPPAVGMAEAVAAEPLGPAAPPLPGSEDPVAIVYTSGTSGEPKGVVLARRNADFLLERVGERLDVLLRECDRPERVYHYLPWCFAGAWIALLAGLARGAVLTLNTDPSRIVEDLQAVRPHWFQNVPVVLERMRQGVEQAIGRRGGFAAALFDRSVRAARARAEGRCPSRSDAICHALARRLLFPSIRRRLGPELRALVCGSAPLAADTQRFFEMLGLEVLQVYGLTETTAICTMDAPGEARAGTVGRAIEGVEMKLGPEGEILVRGPNVFAGYWNRPAATEEAFREGWFRTGDRGEVDADGRWRVLGRIRDSIVLSTGHNVAPEPIERALAERLPAAAQVLLVGSGRPHLAAIVTGGVAGEEVERAVASLNAELAPWQRVRRTLLRAEPFTIESGLVTPTGKLRREAVAAALADEIDSLYAREGAAA